MGNGCEVEGEQRICVNIFCFITMAIGRDWELGSVYSNFE